MGIVSLPSMDDIQQQKDPKQQMEMLINTLGILMKELGEINGYLGGANIRANSITAVKLDVDKLSAITADIGEITAGIIRGIEIYGSYIATAEGTYPRAELSSTDNFFKAASATNQYVAIMPFFSGQSAPMIEFINGITHTSGEIFINNINGDFCIIAPNSIYIDAGASTLKLGGFRVTVPSWSSLIDASTGQTLQQALDAKANI